MKLPENAKKVFKGVIFDIYQWEQEMFDGTKETFEAMKREPSVQIIVVKDDKIILTEEKQPFRGSFTGLVGGQADENEDPKVAAKRELVEETGFEAEKMELWRVYEFGVQIQWKSYYYIAKNCKKIKEPELDAGEQIKLKEVTFEQLFEETEKPEFRNKTFSDWMFRINHNEKEKEEFMKLLFS